MNLWARVRYVPGVETDAENAEAPGAGTDDAALLAAVAGGSEAALRILYDRHAPAVLRLLRRLTSDRSTAEELLQESWLAVWRSSGTFRGTSSVRGWLLGVARRQAHNRLRRRAPASVPLDGDDVPDPPDPGADVEGAVLAAAGHRAVLDAIAALPERHREVVVLAFVDELPYADIAAVLGIPVGTVKSRMAKARARLGAALAVEGGI